MPLNIYSLKQLKDSPPYIYIYIIQVNQMSQTLPSQLFSIKWRSLLGSSGGHKIESSISEITDNAFDAGANNITVFVNPAKNCFAVLDDGSGFANITHALGSGTGLTVKTKGKIGNKNTGMFASIAHFKSKKTSILSRYKMDGDAVKDETIAIHQQLVMYPELISEICNRPGINMDAADRLIMEGANRKIFIDASTGDRDSFVSVDVNQIKDLFDQNQQIVDFFQVEENHGTLICYEFSQGSEIFASFCSTIKQILDKMELITYNTPKYLKSETLKTINYVNIAFPERNQILNNESCKKGFLLGKDAIIDKDDQDWCEEEDNSFFRNCESKTNKNISIRNIIYRNQNDGKLFNILSIEPLGKFYKIDESGEKQELPEDTEFPGDSIAQIYITFSVISQDEGDRQAEIMRKKVDTLRRIAVFYGGRFLNFGDFNGWTQERSLRNVRIAFEISYEAIDLVNIQSMKSRIDLNGAHPVIKNTISKIICPIVAKFTGTNFLSHEGISDWTLPANENIIKQALGIPLPPKPVALAVAVAVVVARPVTMTITPLAQATNTNTNTNVNATMIHRNEANVFPSLNKVQAKEHLNRIKTRLTNGGIVGPKSKGDKSRLFSLLNTIVKEMVFEDDLWDDYIDSIAELIDCSSAKNTSIIKDANKLQDYL